MRELGVVVGLVHWLIDLLLHLDKVLPHVIGEYGGWTYLILFAVIFCETGLVVTPFLPGDSLLFAAGAIAATKLDGHDTLNVAWLFLVMSSAAIAGDSTNYWIGRFVGPRVFRQEKIRFLNREYLDRTHRFYEKYGKKTIVLARFIPIIRTFAPFVAGIGSMPYVQFVSFSVVGTLVWMSLFIFVGYWFGNLQFVSRNFSLVVMVIIFISILPAIVEFLRARTRPAAKSASAR